MHEIGGEIVHHALMHTAGHGKGWRELDRFLSHRQRGVLEIAPGEQLPLWAGMVPVQ